MREILFRGKRLDNGEWVEGYLLKTNDFAYIVYPDCFVDDLFFSPENIICAVDPATVGQFTGLYANGKRIFEGDVVHILGNQDVDEWKSVDYNALIAFLDGGFCAIDGTIEDHAFRRYALMRMDFELEVIGNIHDNPELLEVTPDE